MKLSNPNDRPNIAMKKTLALALIDLTDQRLLQNKSKFEVEYHSIPLIFYLGESFRNNLINLLPDHWIKSELFSQNKIIHLNLEECRAFIKKWPMTVWDDLTDANCQHVDLDGCPVIIQRDFLFIKKNEYSILVCPEELERDGFFNFLRYLLPTLFLDFGQLLIHSSAVVIDHQAYLFLGVSESGKTTMAGLCQKQGAIVLGDDMNILHQDGSVEGAYVGQTIQAHNHLGKRFPLKRIFLLKKASFNAIEVIPASKQLLILYQSLANIFSQSLEQTSLLKLMELTQHWQKIYPVEMLHFNFLFNCQLLMSLKESKEHYEHLL